MAGKLILALHNEEQLPDVVRDELQQMIAAITNWANAIQLGGGNISLQGMATFLGQPRAKLFQNASSGQSIPNGVETVVTWLAARSGSPQEENDIANAFDGRSYFILKEPGTYLVMATVGWGGNATGSRVVGIHPGNLPAVDYFNSVSAPGNALATKMQVAAIVHVPTLGEVISSYNVNPLLVGVMVFQDSGGALTIGNSASTFEYCKIA